MDEIRKISGTIISNEVFARECERLCMKAIQNRKCPVFQPVEPKAGQLTAEDKKCDKEGFVAEKMR